MTALRHLPDLFEVVGIVEEDRYWYNKRHMLDAYRGLTWMTEDELFETPNLDAVIIETDGNQLVPTALRSARWGLHIHLDKPAGQNLRDFDELIGICRQEKLALQLAYIYRYNPALKFCLQAVQNGWLGDIFEIHAVMSRYDGDNPEYRKWLSQFQGGAFYIFGGYLIDLVISMLGEPQRVCSFLKETRGDGLVDNGLAVLEYTKATATIRVSVEEVDGMKHRRFIVCGTNGTIEICPIEAPGGQYHSQPLLARLTLKTAMGGHASGTSIVDCGVLGDRYEKQLAEFWRIIRRKEDNPYPYEHEFLLHRVLLEACQIQT